MNIANSIELYDNASSTLNSIYYGSLSVVSGFDSMSDSIRNIPDVDVSWDSIDIADKFQQQVQKIDSSANEIYELQNEISSRAYEMDILPVSAINDIANVSERISVLSDQVKNLETIDISGRSDEEISLINSQLQRSRVLLDNIQGVQRSINNAISDNNVDALNAGFTRLNDLAGTLENSIERTMSIEPNIEPVEIPVEWVSNSDPPVFMTTGVERYEQELANANALMDDLVSTQADINANAVDVLSPSAMTDLNNINNRMLAIQQRIQQIESNPLNVGTETANLGLENLRHQLAQAQQAQSQLNIAVSNMDIGSANAAYAKLSSTISSTERYIRDNTTEQGNFNNKIAEGSNQADNLIGKIKSAAAAYISLRGIGSDINLSDEITQTDARLNLMIDNFDEAGSVEDLFNKIYASAQDARGSLTETAAVTARFGNNAKDAFSGTDEVVKFANLVQKQMTIAGATTSEASNAMLQLSQGLGSGVLRGDELNSVFENAPNLIQNIADYLEVPIGEIRDMAADGEITGDIVKNAIFAASDEINERFEKMPMTWSQMWTKFQNTAIMAFQPVLNRLNDLANSEAFQRFVEGAITVMAVLANVVLNVFGVMASVGSFIADHWNIISPIIYGIVAALALYTTALIVYNTVQGISNLLKAIHAAALAMEAGATFAATAAQYGFNAALLACPVTWIVLAILTIVALLFVLCNWIAEVTGEAQSGLGIICGALAVGAAFIGNLFIALTNFIIDAMAVLWNFIVSFANFFANVFNDPVGAVARLFFDLVDCVLSLLESLASAIDTIFGSSLAGAVQGWRDGLNEWVDSTFGRGEEVMSKINAGDYHFDRFEYGAAWDVGTAFGDKVSNKISDGIDGLKNMVDGLLNPTTNSGEDALNGIKDNTDEIKKEVKNSDDILSMIKDSISKERIASYTTKQITVDMSGMSNKIDSSLSIGDIVREFEERIAAAASASVEGV
jgi:hypothetical protein